MDLKCLSFIGCGGVIVKNRLVFNCHVSRLNKGIILLLALLLCLISKTSIQAQEIDSISISRNASLIDGSVTIKGKFPGLVGKNASFVSLGSESSSISPDQLSKKNGVYTYKGANGDLVKSFKYTKSNSKLTLKLKSSHIPVGETEVLIGNDPIYFFKLLLKSKKKQKINGPLEPINTGDLSASGSINQSGGSLQLTNDVLLELAPQAAAGENVSITSVTLANLPAALPNGVSPLMPAMDIVVSIPGSAEPILKPATLTINLPTSLKLSDGILSVVHYEGDGQYEPLTVKLIDYDSKVMVVETRVFSPLVVVLIPSLLTPPPAAALPFLSSQNGWSITNNESVNDLTPGGTCLGMSSFAKWFYAAHSSEKLSSSIAGLDASLLATRAHLSMIPIWAQLISAAPDIFYLFSDNQEQSSENWIVSFIKTSIATFKSPVIVTLFGENHKAHAVLAFGYNENYISIYDPNFPGIERQLFYNGNGISDYVSGKTYSSFGITGTPSLGSYSEFEQLWLESKQKFSSSSIKANWSGKGGPLKTGTVAISGSVTNGSWTNVLVYLNGEFQENIAIVNKKFKFTTLLEIGSNSLILLAGNAGGKYWNFGSAMYFSDIEVAEPSGVVGVVYVDQDAIGKNDGSSWKNAFTDVEAAVDDALSNSDFELWIAEGSYQLNSALDIKTLKVYGSFTGNEISPAQRSFTSPTTKFVPGGYHGVIMRTQSRLDGIEISNGIADYPLTNGFATSKDSRGGAVLVDAAGLYGFATIHRCHFQNNLGIGGGGAVALVGYGAELTVSDSSFINNRAYVQYNDVTASCGMLSSYSSGGAIYVDTQDVSPAYKLKLRVLNSVFSENVARAGGAIGTFIYPTVVVDNSLFIANKAFSGSAINLASAIAGGGITNNKFMDNVSYYWPYVVYKFEEAQLIQQGNTFSGNTWSQTPCP